MTKQQMEDRIVVLERAVIKMALWISLLSGGEPTMNKEVAELVKEVAGGV